MQYISPLPSLRFQEKYPRSLTICGSTGSIGVNTLAIISAYPELFKVFALGAGKNIALVKEQALKFKPKYIAVQEEMGAKELESYFSSSDYKPEILFGQEAYAFIASHEEVDVFVSAQVGAAGLKATLAAANGSKVICLANKESLVLAGDFIKEACYRTNASILPIDSEHHALFQCLLGHEYKDVNSLIITASGGALRDKSYEFLQRAKASDALKHPNWSMGAKITIDSATLMNKGLELIEACYLYGVDISSIKVVVHPQSIVHSMVEYNDGSIMAQLSKPDMRLPIAHCIAYPKTLEASTCSLPLLDLALESKLSFENVNNTHFPCLEIAKNAYKENKSIALNAANEELVAAFLKDRIYFMQIPEILESILEKADYKISTTDDIFLIDEEYRRKCLEKIQAIRN